MTNKKLFHIGYDDNSIFHAIVIADDKEDAIRTFRNSFWHKNDSEEFVLDLIECIDEIELDESCVISDSIGDG